MEELGERQAQEKIEMELACKTWRHLLTFVSNGSSTVTLCHSFLGALAFFTYSLLSVTFPSLIPEFDRIASLKAWWLSFADEWFLYEVFDNPTDSSLDFSWGFKAPIPCLPPWFQAWRGFEIPCSCAPRPPSPFHPAFLSNCKFLSIFHASRLLNYQRFPVLFLRLFAKLQSLHETSNQFHETLCTACLCETNSFI